MNRFWERVMLALVVCVPVPALALSGLNVPLPSVVERIAAKLVPFASVGTLDDGTTLAASGRIVHTQAREVTGAVTASRTRTKVVVRVRRPTAPTGAPTPKQQPSNPRVVAAPTPVNTLAPATPHEDTTPSIPEPSAPTPSPSTPAPTPTPTPTLTPTPTPDTRPKPKPDDRLEPTPVDTVTPDPTDPVGPKPEPDVKPEPEVDVYPPVADVEPFDPPGSTTGDATRDETALENTGRGSGKK